MELDTAVKGFAKKCYKCLAEKTLADFYVCSLTVDGLLGKCKECCSDQAKEYRAANRATLADYDQARGRADVRRLLQQRYKAMKQRVMGSDKYSTAKGKDILTWSEFICWSLEPKNWHTFWKLFKEWEESGYLQKLSPSIDRLDNSGGYTEANMQWLTHSANARKH